ncbi:unnamed protein product [Ceutorhynchus assimilis]|uniref:MADF domain-containing protein n=1 Tax=Ceutorhynchus assimilis TaxID=467358 RepID=A0A9N9MJE8_9CUCU|nr:unnamed protein product [Ceutorhynchus assimilis]
MEDHRYYASPFQDDTENIFQEEVLDNSENRNFDELLIDMVKGYPHLYNKADTNFKDALMKENSWQEIANVSNASVLDCKNRWTRLRERFSREKKNIEDEFRSGSGASQRQKWLLYTNMEFLKPFVAGRKTVTNIVRTDVSNQLKIDNVYTQNSENKKVHVSLDNSTIEEQPKIVPSTCINKEKASEKAIRPCFKRQRVQDNVDLSIMNLSAAVTSHISSQKSQPSSSQRSDDLFGNLIVEELAKLDEPQKSQKKREILKVLYNY